MRKTGFTLIEIMIGILIVSIIILWGFSALSAVTVGKVRLIEKTNIEKEAFYFSQKLFEMIKSWWTLDYEEYWNRKVVDNTSFTWGHFSEQTWFWNYWATWDPTTQNYWNWLYYCLSWSGSANYMWTNGCVERNNTSNNASITEVNYLDNNEAQRYGQYALQFINFNINADNDSWLPGDEDSDGSIIWDDDDEYLGEGPEVFWSDSEITELYLISGNKKKRTFFRYSVITDPNRPTGIDCSSSDNRIFTGSGCLGTIQFLQLEWKDWWSAHDPNGSSSDEPGTRFDGVIDTWVIDEKFNNNQPLAGTGWIDDHWVNLFPDTIHVSDFEIYAYPNKDRELAWKEDENHVNIAPYIRLTLKLQPSWKKRKLIKWTVPELDLSTTISLTDLYSQ